VGNAYLTFSTSTGASRQDPPETAAAIQIGDPLPNAEPIATGIIFISGNLINAWASRRR
jgi:hypothetical protein